MSEATIAQLPYEGYRSKQMADKSWQTIIDHPELLPEQVRDMAANSSTAGWLVVKPNELVTLEDIPTDDSPAEPDMKTPSQRLRGVLFVLWEQTGAQGDFDTYYRRIMESLINKYKEKLQ